MAADLALVGRGGLVPAMGPAGRAPHRRLDVAEPGILTPVADLEIGHAVAADLLLRDPVSSRYGHIITIGSIIHRQDNYMIFQC